MDLFCEVIAFSSLVFGICAFGTTMDDWTTSSKRLKLDDCIFIPSGKTPEKDYRSAPAASIPIFKPRGRPSITMKFPEIVPIGTAFVQNNGFQAHSRRRATTGSCGVTIPQLQEHLLQVRARTSLCTCKG